MSRSPRPADKGKRKGGGGSEGVSGAKRHASSGRISKRGAARAMANAAGKKAAVRSARGGAEAGHSRPAESSSTARREAVHTRPRPDRERPSGTGRPTSRSDTRAGVVIRAVNTDRPASEGGGDPFTRPWHFVKSVVGLEHLPEMGPPEIAFAGRSNVGKSSLINALIRHNGMARTSNTPGRTQELNYFTVAWEPSFYLVDMPGYGFAKAPKEKVEAWTELVKDYLRGRQTLVRVLLLIDSRHGLKTVDGEIMSLLDGAGVTFQVVLTKADKITPLALAKVIAATEAALTAHPAAFPVVIATSSEKGTGMDELRAAVTEVVEAHAR